MKALLCNCAILIGMVSFWLSSTSLTLAQVAVGPGYAVAPCVSVEWDCRHVHVCAPFVNLDVNLPGCCGCTPTCCTTDAYNRSTNTLYGQATRQRLMQAAGELDQSLARFETADSWRSYLALKPGQALASELPQQRETEMNVSEGNTLIAILHRFDAANGDEKNRVITSLPEFQKVHTLLANYVAGLPSRSKSRVDFAVFTNSGAADSAHVARVGWAVDTARVPTGHSAENGKDRPVSTARMNATTAEELPEPVSKQGS